MVIKKCIVCGKKFNATRGKKCCTPECSKKRTKQKQSEWYNKNKEITIERSANWQKNNKKRKAEINKKWNEENKEHVKKIAHEYYEKNKEKHNEVCTEWNRNNREKCNKYTRKWRENHRDEIREYGKEYYSNNRDEILKKKYIREQNIISDLCEQYHGDLEQILEKIPSRWQVREAKMRVWFNESYYDGIMAKVESTLVCEVTGKKDNLVIHHLYSFNTHPELGGDPNNMVRITSDVHDDFHKIYGYGNNTPGQWVEFLQKRR